MTRDKMTEILSETICVTREEARAALEAKDWKLLDAAQLLQQEDARAEAARAGQAGGDSGWRRIGNAVRGLFARVARRRSEDPAPELPAMMLVPILLSPSVRAGGCW